MDEQPATPTDVQREVAVMHRAPFPWTERPGFFEPARAPDEDERRADETPPD
jgi:hypothetical protein